MIVKARNEIESYKNSQQVEEQKENQDEANLDLESQMETPADTIKE